MVLAATVLLALQGSFTPPFFEETGQTANPIPLAYTGFARRIDSHQGRLVVGAPLDSTSGVYAGAVHVYEPWNGWSVPAKTLKASDAYNQRFFGTHVAVHGDTIAVADDRGQYSSDLYVFERVGGVWTEVAHFPTTVSSGAGNPLALTGSYLLVGHGAYNNPATQYEFLEGAVHVYDRSAGTWGLTQTLVSPVPDSYDWFGLGISLSVAPSLERLAITSKGDVHVFERAAGLWADASTIPGLTSTGSSAIDLSGDRLLMASPSATVNGKVGSGVVEVRAWDGQAWQLESTLQHPVPAKNQYFGIQLLLDGDQAYVTTLEDKSTGSIHVFAFDGVTWSHVNELRPAGALEGDAFGTTPTVDGGQLLTASPGLDYQTNSNSGVIHRLDRTDHETYCTAGTSGAGCNALLSVAGTASASAASGFTVTASGVQGNRRGYFFYGSSGRQAAPWGKSSSFQCVVPPVKRAGLSPKQGTQGQCDADHIVDLTALWTAKPNKNPGAGSLVQVQFWYRDPNNTSNQTTSLSDAVEVYVSP